MFGVAGLVPGEVNWTLVEGETFAVHAAKVSTGWDGRTWTATYRSSAESDADPIDMVQSDDSTSDALDFTASIDADDLVVGGYRYKIMNTNPSASPANKVTAFMWGTITVVGAG